MATSLILSKILFWFKHILSNTFKAFIYWIKSTQNFKHFKCCTDSNLMITWVHLQYDRFFCDSKSKKRKKEQKISIKSGKIRWNEKIYQVKTEKLKLPKLCVILKSKLHMLNMDLFFLGWVRNRLVTLSNLIRL